MKVSENRFLAMVSFIPVAVLSQVKMTGYGIMGYLSVSDWALSCLKASIPACSHCANATGFGVYAFVRVRIFSSVLTVAY